MNFTKTLWWAQKFRSRPFSALFWKLTNSMPRRAARANRARVNLAADRATSLPEVWANVAKHLGFAGAREVLVMEATACRRQRCSPSLSSV